MNLDHQRAAAHQLCSDLDISVLPYGNAWWLLGSDINQVIGEIAGLGKLDIVRMQRPLFSRG